jgi:hypothetical protein
MFEFLMFSLFAIIYLLLTVFFWYWSWFNPGKLQRTLLKLLDSKVFRYTGPFRRIQMVSIQSPIYVWAIRILTLAVLLFALAFMVVTILISTGLIPNF